jgi:cytochrome c oxidase subunit 2
MASQESWLKQNPDYLKYVPDNLKEAAMIKAGLPLSSTIQTHNSVTLK